MVTKNKGGRPTAAQILERKRAAAREAKYEEQESKRATRIMPDTNHSLWVALAMAGVGLVTSFVVSYSTLVAVAGWMRLEWDVLNWVVPGFIEVMILFSTIDYIIVRSRGASGRVPFWAMVGFSAIAVVGNFAHSLASWLESGEVPWYGWIGILLSAVTPLVVVYLSKRASALVFSEVIEEA